MRWNETEMENVYYCTVLYVCTLPRFDGVGVATTIQYNTTQHRLGIEDTQIDYGGAIRRTDRSYGCTVCMWPVDPPLDGIGECFIGVKYFWKDLQ